MAPQPIAHFAEHPRAPRARWRALWVGDADRDEFGPTRDWFTSRTSWRRVDAISEAVDLLESGDVPQVLVLAKSRPGQYSSEQIDRVRRVAPLVRIVEVLGAWCEGESCSGSRLHGTWRLAWHQSAQRLEAEWFRYQQGLVTVWETAVTASEDELSMRPPLQCNVRGSVLVEIVSRDLLLADGMRGACRSFGLLTRWCDPCDRIPVARSTAHPADLVLYVAAGHRDYSFLGELDRQAVPVPWIALLGFPRWCDHVEACRAGAAAVVSLPAVADALQTAIATVLPDRLSLWPDVSWSSEAPSGAPLP